MLQTAGGIPRLRARWPSDEAFAQNATRCFHTARLPDCQARKRWFPPPSVTRAWGGDRELGASDGGWGRLRQRLQFGRPCLGPQNGPFARLGWPQTPPRWHCSVCRRVPWPGIRRARRRQTGTQQQQSSFAGLIARIICTSADHRLLADSPAALAWCKPTLTRILEPGLSKLCLSAVGACTCSAAARV